MNINRYSRQIVLKDFGVAGQEKLLHSKVLVIGIGGLGCPAVQYLAAAGIGTLGIMDDDVVSLTNLHRQVLFSTTDIGKRKTDVAQHKLGELNTEIKINVHSERITNQNALSVIRNYDYVLDGTDNFSSRYLINDACVLLGKPLIYGAVSQYEGQVAVFNVPDANGTSVNYRDLFPTAPLDGEILNCAQAGVLGVLPGIIGSLQAAELIKLITGLGKPLINKLLTYSVLDQDIFTLELTPAKNRNNSGPSTDIDFETWDYGMDCLIKPGEIDGNEFDEMKTNAIVVDVREHGELPEITSFSHLHIPLSALENRLGEIAGQNVIFICQSGVRSRKAMDIYSSRSKSGGNVYSLKGGILKLNTVAL